MLTPSFSSHELPTESLVSHYLSIVKMRPEILFRYFLPLGYRRTTLSSVDLYSIESVVYAKLHLGMIITLFDDLADNPKFRNANLLAHLYQLNIEKEHVLPSTFSPASASIFQLASLLFKSLTRELKYFPQYEELKSVLSFDLEQFYLSNRYSEMLATVPATQNLQESRALGPFNMGIVAAGIIDLMASPKLSLKELGQCRKLLLLGQRLGRISNVLVTLEREQKEGDLTNEILIAKTSGIPVVDYRIRLHDEFEKKKKRIENTKLLTFDTKTYADGIQYLDSLHKNLKGKI